jgi:hypothetical protein
VIAASEAIYCRNAVLGLQQRGALRANLIVASPPAGARDVNKVLVVDEALELMGKTRKYETAWMVPTFAR